MHRALKYNRVTTGESRAYPELQPSRFAADPDEVFGRALEVARAMGGWRSFTVDPEKHHFACEAVSRLFRFVDDVDVWVSEEAGEAVVKVRSKSRVGRGDLGANARRIKRFQAAIEAAMS